MVLRLGVMAAEILHFSACDMLVHPQPPMPPLLVNVTAGSGRRLRRIPENDLGLMLSFCQNIARFFSSVARRWRFYTEPDSR